MDVFLMLLVVVLFGVSVAGCVLLWMPERPSRTGMIDGDLYDADELLVALGTTQEWI